MLSEKVHGPFRRYSVSYAIEPADITFLSAPDGKIHAAFELVIFVFNSEGVLVNRLSTQLRIASPLDELKKNIAHGIQYTQQISAPAKGEDFVSGLSPEELRAFSITSDGASGGGHQSSAR